MCDIRIKKRSERKKKPGDDNGRQKKHMMFEDITKRTWAYM